MKGQSQRARRQRVREVLTLLGKPVCQQILIELGDGDADATALAEVVDRSTSTLRKYLARLCAGGVIRKDRIDRRMVYSLDPNTTMKRTRGGTTIAARPDALSRVELELPRSR